jgi:hypothetical protein
MRNAAAGPSASSELVASDASSAAVVVDEDEEEEEGEEEDEEVVEEASRMWKSKAASMSGEIHQLRSTLMPRSAEQLCTNSLKSVAVRKGFVGEVVISRDK